MAAEVEVTWTDPDKYTDIHAGEDNRASFRSRTFANFDKHFAKLAKKLPDGLTLKVDVSNVDLAGSTFHAGISRIRVIKDTYPPRMKFSYQLLNADKKVELSGEADLKNMSFMTGTQLRYRNQALGYEKELLDKWFAETFKQQIVK